MEAPTPATVAAQIAPRRLTQEQIDREVTRALRNAEKDIKPADYDEVRAQAERATELEQKIADLQGEISHVQLESLRTSVAARFGVSDEDRALLMTGADEATLTLQAERLGAPAVPMRNVAPREGTYRQTGDNRSDREMSSFVNELMGNDTFWD
ncbi:hypothetical protein [Microbacterium sp. UFMG61]|uniref:hypothetical protein n=1 Tax=Microbacterium sp. UFMG61 TaxID=2745935 RepID=UPI00188F6EAB|nr:hypothetical protein [Microbacterium sp. UFMG61]